MDKEMLQVLQVQEDQAVVVEVVEEHIL